MKAYTLPSDEIRLMTSNAVHRSLVTSYNHPLLSHPTRSSPLPYMHKITDTYDTAPLRNPITPKASLSGPGRVFASPELHQHFIRDRLIPRSRRRVNVGKLKNATRVFQRVSHYRRTFCLYGNVPDIVYTWKPNLLAYRSQESPCSEISQVP